MFWFARVAAMALALVLAGCAHTPKDEVARSLASRPPSFLIGPMSLLLTNASTGFSARVGLTGQPFSTPQEFHSGDLLGRGSKLLFAPDFKGSKARARAGGVSFIWDSAEHQGFVVSEVMQAYAPFSSTLRETNLVINADAASPQ